MLGADKVWFVMRATRRCVTTRGVRGGGVLGSVCPLQKERGDCVPSEEEDTRDEGTVVARQWLLK